jgi:hypothetical protein
MKWEYVAGFTDGDGCISIFNPWTRISSYKWVTLIWNQKASESVVLDHLLAFFNEEGIDVSPRRYSTNVAGRQFPQRELRIYEPAFVRRILEAMEPHLVLKRAKALEGLEVLDLLDRARAEAGYYYSQHFISLMKENKIKR